MLIVVPLTVLTVLALCVAGAWALLLGLGSIVLVSWCVRVPQQAAMTAFKPQEAHNRPTDTKEVNPRLSHHIQVRWRPFDEEDLRSMGLIPMPATLGREAADRAVVALQETVVSPSLSTPPPITLTAAEKSGERQIIPREEEPETHEHHRAARTLRVPTVDGRADVLYAQYIGERGMVVLIDGQGSSHTSAQDGGERVQEVVKDMVLPWLEGKVICTEPELKKLLLRGIQKANDALVGRKQQDGSSAMLLAALVVKTTVYVANVGTIRAYVLDEDGLALVSHVTKTPFLGEADGVSPDMFKLHLQAGTLLILGTDGVWAGLSHHQIETLVMAHELTSLVSLAEMLIQGVRQANDHRSVIVLRM